MPLENALPMQEEVAKQASLNPDRPAMADARETYTVGEIDERANRLAHALVDDGLSKGDIAAVLLPNRIEWGEVVYGSFTAGVLPAGINFHFTAEQMEHAVESVGADFFLFDAEFADTVERVRRAVDIPDDRFVVLGSDDRFRGYDAFTADRPTDAPSVEGTGVDDDGMVLYTSGTTGVPKPIVATQRSYISGFFQHASVMGVSEDDRSLLLMPFFHGNSLFYFTLTHYLGGFVYVEKARGFDPERTLSIMEEGGITFTSMVPTHFNGMLHDADVGAYDLELETALTSSAPLSRAVKERILEEFDCDVFEGYGSVEAGIQVMLRPRDQLHKTGSVGTAIPGSDMVVLDPESEEPVEPGEIGEIYTRGPTTMERYYGMPEKTAAVTLERDGGEWITAGDMGRIDEDGFLYMVQRKDDMIVTGGENVYPSHVEETLHEHDAVKDVAVIGVPDEKWGEAVRAVVVPADDARPDGAELVDFCRGKVADYEVPKGVDFVDELPRTPTGKILRREVREDYWDGERDYSEL